MKIDLFGRRSGPAHRRSFEIPRVSEQPVRLQSAGGSRASATRQLLPLFLAMASGLSLYPFAEASAGTAHSTCNLAELPPGHSEDLEVTGLCVVRAGEYHYGDINIHSGGMLWFMDEKISLWTKGILIENQSALIAGSPKVPIGTEGGQLDIHLYGKDQGAKPFLEDADGSGAVGITCKTPTTAETGECGIPKKLWEAKGGTYTVMPWGDPANPKAEDKDFFYPYEPLAYAKGKNSEGKQGYFGTKVLAVSYGGILYLAGKKGASYDDLKPTDSGTSWVRLATDPANAADRGLDAGESTLHLNRAVDWAAGDHIVVTPTDYLPGHAEEFEIKKVSDGGKTVTVTSPAKYFHNGKTYNLSDKAHSGIAKLGLDIHADGVTDPAAETRASVALLTRSIRIMSAGENDGDPFPDEKTLFPATEQGGSEHPYYFGGQTIVRQGAWYYHVQGVEFKQLGQGGRMEYYPVHFHQTRKMPPGAALKDCSIDDSMTRWVVIDGTSGLELDRNVGYKSIGHGFYLAQGTETDNKFYSNIGIFARAAVDNVQNPRKVPGIFASQRNNYTEQVPFYTDIDHPTVFWIANGWNDFEGNMAAGAGTCGVCYWLVPEANSNQSRDQQWSGYASLQSNARAMQMAGTSPLKTFSHNYCSTAMTSFQTVDNTTQCTGVDVVGDPNLQPALKSVPNPLAPVKPLLAPKPGQEDKGNYAVQAHPEDPVYDYYPYVLGDGHNPTRCEVGSLDIDGKPIQANPDGSLDCSRVAKCANGNQNTNCMVTVLDHYTSAFHWAEVNFAAIWLRPKWHLVTNSVLSDVLGGGVTFVTGGDYTTSSAIIGGWNLLTKSALIGNSQPLDSNPASDHIGPFNGKTKDANGDILDCAKQTNGAYPGNYCLSKAEGISMPLNNFNVMQRMFNIYDGPANQESNAYLDITTAPIGCTVLADKKTIVCNDAKTMYRSTPGIKRKVGTNECYLQNAAIGWKQPNGFFYPPTFHSRNLYFDNVDIRHMVVQPLFTENGVFKTDAAKVKEEYCTGNDAMFAGWTDIDRQTVLTDGDGSLTGVANTVSVNSDPFFTAPKEVFECQAEKAVKTSPYEYVTTVIYPGCAANTDAGSAEKACDAEHWGQNGAAAFGVQLYRQFVTGSENSATTPGGKIFMSGGNLWQRNTLTANKGYYYIDTTVPYETQAPLVPDPKWTTVFQPGKDYYLFWVYAKPGMHQAYQLYVGKGADKTTVEDNVKLVRADVPTINFGFKQGTWPKDAWMKDYDPDSGLLTIILDSNFKEFTDAWTSASQTACMPSSFCAPKGSACGCAVDSQGNKLDPTCTEDICKWAGKDVDCPEGGCFGIQWTMPTEFKSDGKGTEPLNVNGGHKPANLCFPSTDEMAWTWDWNWNNVPFGSAVEVKAEVAGQRCLDENAANHIDNFNFCTNK